jgi:SAM-dependent methyltransferase
MENDRMSDVALAHPPLAAHRVRSVGDRPRLLSYVGRWGRARRWLPTDARRVLDIGSAFGYGTAALTGYGRGRRWVIGVERDPGHVRHAARSYPWLPLVHADASALPVADGTVDAVILLDVLEHMTHPAAVLADARRVLRPGGFLIFSVPHRGLLAGLDSLNVYPMLRRRWPSWPPLEPADECASGAHRHFSIDEARTLLGAGFRLDRVARTGLGASELLHLALLVGCKALLRARRVYLALLPLHLLTYILDDLIPAGPLGDHLTVRARAI